MGWYGSGYVTMMIYGAIASAVIEEFSLTTESGINITTESGSNILLEDEVI